MKGNGERFQAALINHKIEINSKINRIIIRQIVARHRILQKAKMRLRETGWSCSWTKLNLPYLIIPYS